MKSLSVTLIILGFIFCIISFVWSTHLSVRLDAIEEKIDSLNKMTQKDTAAGYGTLIIIGPSVIETDSFTVQKFEGNFILPPVITRSTATTYTGVTCSLPLKQPKKEVHDYLLTPYSIQYDSMFGSGWFVGAKERVTVPDAYGMVHSDNMQWDTVIMEMRYNEAVNGFYFLPRGMNDPYSYPVYEQDTCKLKVMYNKYLKQLK